MRNIYMLFFFALFILMHNASYAERKKIAEPQIISLDSKKYLDKNYSEKIYLLELEVKKLGDQKIIASVESLKNELRGEKAKQVLGHIENRLKKIKSDNAKNIEKILSDVNKDIDSLRFTNGRIGIDFVADKENRLYIVSWREGGIGEEIVKKIPMPPSMEIIVKANYSNRKIDGKDVMAFQYMLQSGPGNKADIIGIYLENKFTVEYLKEHVISKTGSYRTIKIAPNVKSEVTYPSSNRNFILRRYEIKEETILSLDPGKETEYPYIFPSIDGSLPGIVKCYIDLSPNDYVSFKGLSEGDPGIAIDLFAGSSEQHKFDYSANTIGSVPIPVPFDRVEFIDKIISYNEKSISEGWNDKVNVIKFTREELIKIKSNPSDTELIQEFVNDLEGYFNKQQILPEAYVLLKYNLKYLL